MDKKYMKISIGRKGTFSEYNVLEYLNEKGVLSPTDIIPAVTMEGLLSLVHIIKSGLVSPNQSKEVLYRMVQDKEMDATKAAHNLGYGGKDTCGDLETIIDDVVDECSDELTNELLDKLVAKVMARCTIKPNPKCLKNIIANKLCLPFDSTDNCEPQPECVVDINIVDKDKLNADLLKAVSHRDASLVRNLLNKGADINTKDRRGNTPLHLAVGHGFTAICELLLEYGANVNAKCDDDETPLHRAALVGWTEICKLLLDHGADVNDKDKEGNTPLYLTFTFKHLETCNLLRQYGAKLLLWS